MGKEQVDLLNDSELLSLLLQSDSQNPEQSPNRQGVAIKDGKNACSGSRNSSRRTRKNEPKSKAFIDNSGDEEFPHLPIDPGCSSKPSDGTEITTKSQAQERQKHIRQHNANSLPTRGKVQETDGSLNHGNATHGGHLEGPALFNSDMEGPGGNTTTRVSGTPRNLAFSGLSSFVECQSLVEGGFSRMQTRMKTDFDRLARDLASHRREFTVLRHQYHTILQQNFATKEAAEQLEEQANAIYRGEFPSLPTGHD